MKLAISVKEAAALLGVSADLVYEWCRRGEIPHRRMGRRILISREGLARWLADGNSGGREEPEPNR
jgi:excisionase family DNA binding protein